MNIIAGQGNDTKHVLGVSLKCNKSQVLLMEMANIEKIKVKAITEKWIGQ